MKLRVYILILIFNFLFVDAQMKKIDYAKIEIEVPSNYNSPSEFKIENDNFSAQWIYLPAKSFNNNMKLEIFDQLGIELQSTEVEDIEFTSCNESFIGRKYFLEKSILKYRILAFGIINEQPLLLNLGFKNNPKNESEFDELILRFIRFK